MKGDVDNTRAMLLADRQDEEVTRTENREGNRGGGGPSAGGDHGARGLRDVDLGGDRGVSQELLFILRRNSVTLVSKSVPAPTQRPTLIVLKGETPHTTTVNTHYL